MTLRRKPVPATETAAESAAPLCDARSDSIRARCALPKGHVATMNDWHEADGESQASVRTNVFEHVTTTSEHFRWQPNMFELPAEARTKAITDATGLKPVPAAAAGPGTDGGDRA